MRSLIIAHRGASFCAPENTLAAFKAALELGADGIETDVQLTGDGKLVLHHNYTIDASSNGHGSIARMTLKELMTYDFGAYKGERWAGEPIPTLDECLNAAKGLKLVNIEMKAPFDRTVPFVKIVTDAVKAHGMTESVVISAFDHDLLREVKLYSPEMRVGILTMPIGFSNNRLFKILHTYLPRDRKLSEVSRESLANIPVDAFNPSDYGIPAADAPDAIVELAKQIGAVYPRFTLEEAANAMALQNDHLAYIADLDFKPDYLHCHYSSILKDPSLIENLALMGVSVNVWTPDAPEELRKLSKMGCFGIITNRPDILLEIQKELLMEKV